MKPSLLTLSAAFALAGVSQAAILVDNFDSYPNNNDMNGLGTWSVTNGLSGTDPVSIATDFTFDGSAGAALIGGLAPNFAGPTVLSSAVSAPVFTVGQTATFSMDFGFLDSTDANRDSYSISLASTGGNLLTIDLTPAASVNTFNISFSSGYFASLVDWGTLDALDTAGNPFFQILFETSRDGVGNMFYSLSDVNSGVISSGALAAGLSDTFTGLSVSVDTTGGAGDGFLVIDNVNVIPEPSSALLGLLGASFAFLRRRRA